MGAPGAGTRRARAGSRQVAVPEGETVPGPEFTLPIRFIVEDSNYLLVVEKTAVCLKSYLATLY